MSTVRLDLDLSDDDQCDIAVCKNLQDLVDGSIDPLTAARNITHAIAVDNQAKTDIWNSTPPAGIQAIRDNRTFPNGDGWHAQITEHYMAKIGMQVPFDHPGQDRIVQMLQEMQKMPRQTVYQEGDGSKLRSVELWNISPTYRHSQMKQWLWEMTYADGGMAHFPPDVPRPGFFNGEDDGNPEWWLNYSAFLARLLASGVQEVTISCPLDGYGAFAKNSPKKSLNDDPLESARLYEPSASAAALWMIYSGDAMYEMCENDAMFMIGEGKYTHAKWEQWKAKFNMIVADERYSQRCRDFVKQALEVMAKCEAEGPKNFIVDHYDMMSKRDYEEDEDEAEEEDVEVENTEEGGEQ